MVVGGLGALLSQLTPWVFWEVSCQQLPLKKGACARDGRCHTNGGSTIGWLTAARD